MENEVPNYVEWLKKRQNHTKVNNVRADAYHDSAFEKDKWLWKWFRDSFAELNNIYQALEWADNYRREDSIKILQMARENQTKIENQFKMLLGLNESAGQKDVEERAKVLGAIVTDTLEKLREKEEREKILSDKVLKK